ncbi:FkbM family methyltransferase [Parerythrobacter lacustris]|uniref:FkbM family methyltransferase n=1 Tax=Parerythrobacter lacustris TaxID=2969984 RepID=A0ABT1XLV7_9SPHN|nr:FkbM family methyltransferase [Parerythrobacter lacustris]MCR2832557.1 FkbM family methyltransferase [Parerythrobacter lacustris]
MTLDPPTPENLARLGLRFETFEMHSGLRKGEAALRFPHAATGSAIEPADWLAAKHAEGAMHEPGLVAWLFALGSALGNAPVRLFDIGAAYGYFSALATLAFADIDIVAVEPDPALAGYVASVLRANRLARARVENVLLSDVAGSAELDRRNFHYLPAGTAVSPGYARHKIEMRTLLDILGEPDARRDILKIDTEGWQARFLPPATPALIAREAVLLLECDRADKLAPHGGTNAQLVAPFVAAGYDLLWCDHRDPAFRVEHLPALGPGHERNALAVLLPPGLHPGTISSNLVRDE